MQIHFNPQVPNELRLDYQVQASDLDALNHVNNKVYLDWMEILAWQHSLAVGIDSNTHQQLGKIMIVHQHELNYHQAAKLHDQLTMRTWLLIEEKSIGCCGRKRYYEIHRHSDGKKLFSAHTHWVCMDLNTQKASRLPAAFIDPYFNAH